MAMLDRYKKSGGFHQLVSLIETCGPAKREKFMEMIRQEDPNWADALSVKLLDMERIFKWEDQTLMEVFSKVQDLTAAIVIKTVDETTQSRIMGFLSQSQIRKLSELMETTNANPAEVSTLQMKFLQDVRKLAHEGVLRFDKIDPTLVIEPDIEEQLNRPHGKSAASHGGSQLDDMTAAGDKMDTSGGASNFELAALKKKVLEMQKEIAILRRELSVAKGKLDQIKKIA